MSWFTFTTPASIYCQGKGGDRIWYFVLCYLAVIRHYRNLVTLGMKLILGLTRPRIRRQ